MHLLKTTYLNDRCHPAGVLLMWICNGPYKLVEGVWFEIGGWTGFTDGEQEVFVNNDNGDEIARSIDNFVASHGTWATSRIFLQRTTHLKPKSKCYATMAYSTTTRRRRWNSCTCTYLISSTCWAPNIRVYSYIHVSKCMLVIHVILQLPSSLSSKSSFPHCILMKTEFVFYNPSVIEIFFFAFNPRLFWY